MGMAIPIRAWQGRKVTRFSEKALRHHVGALFPKTRFLEMRSVRNAFHVEAFFRNAPPKCTRWLSYLSDG
jgi:hypothetical protein